VNTEPFDPFNRTGESVDLDSRHRVAIAGRAFHPRHRPVGAAQNFFERLVRCGTGTDVSKHHQVQRRGGAFVELPGQAVAQIGNAFARHRQEREGNLRAGTGFAFRWRQGFRFGDK
jgi:hypothetical protein